MKIDETMPFSKVQLNTLHRNGARTSTDCFSSHVGSGSLVHCLSGSLLTISVTSASETGEKSRSSQPTGAGVKSPNSPKPSVSDTDGTS